MSLNELEEPNLNVGLLISNVHIAEISTFRVTPSTVECPFCLGSKKVWICDYVHVGNSNPYYKMKCKEGHYLTQKSSVDCSTCKGTGRVNRG